MNKKQKRVLIRILSAAGLLVIAMLLPISGWIRIISLLVPYVIVGYDVLFSAIRNILHGQIFDEQFLMSIATVGAVCLGDFPEATAVMLFYQLGELFQSIAVGNSRKNIAKLMDIRPDSAVVLRDGKEIEVSPEEVEIGEVIIVRAGEKIPLDGVIVSGLTSVDTSALTGESLPADKTVGERVISGSINLTGVIEVKTQSRFEASTVSKILQLCESSLEKKARSEKFITRFARYYTPCVVIGAAALAFIPPLLFNQPWSEWISRALNFLVVSCPCALVVSVPLTFFGGIGAAARKGVLVKGAGFLEALSTVDTAVFDKTGTVTEGRFSVQKVHSVTGEDIVPLAAIIESRSNHPIAQAISAYCTDFDPTRLESLNEVAGMGVEAVVDGKLYFLGNASLMQKAGAKIDTPDDSPTTVYLSRGDRYLGSICVSDTVKPGAKTALDELKALGVTKTVMLTGDSERAAEIIAKEVGVDEVYAQLLPSDKVTRVEDLLGDGRKVAFIGDGINDAPVLARADVGIAMGALGSDAAIESADIVLMKDALSDIAFAVRLARKTMRIVRQNITFALLVKAAILILSAFGFVNMWIAVFGDVGVMLLSVLNAMRTMKQEKTK